MQLIMNGTTARFGRLDSKKHFEYWENAVQFGGCDVFCKDALTTVSTTLSVHHASANVAALESIQQLQV